MAQANVKRTELAVAGRRKSMQSNDDQSCQRLVKQQNLNDHLSLNHHQLETIVIQYMIAQLGVTRMLHTWELLIGEYKLQCVF